MLGLLATPRCQPVKPTPWIGCLRPSIAESNLKPLAQHRIHHAKMSRWGRKQMGGCPVVADLLPLTQGLRPVASQCRAHRGKTSRWRWEQTIGCPVAAEPLPLLPCLRPVARRVELLDPQQQDQEDYAAAKDSLVPPSPRTQID